MMSNRQSQDIPAVVWLIFPIASYGLLYGVLFTGFPPFIADRFGSEQGILENIQVLFLLLFLVLGGKMWCAKEPRLPARLRIWVMLLMGGVLYILVEEVSWGQHYFGWATPEWIANLNRQNETNLHNVDTDIFFQIPRLLVMYLPYNLLLAAIYVGGIISHRGQGTAPVLVLAHVCVYTMGGAHRVCQLASSRWGMDRSSAAGPAW
ncbi:MAG: hypothetical protein ETSY2_53570 [Candidatus Entotheonella gemina]|uniref:Uncharacterized protein n=1 Tax=Candidatus Entotheonella gemina TaxID=1429439 RepID=W4L3Z2_9BACT|nr:MAG: hypothetical protein ETSY2_53570 [Candidatus Entotheonella gemina]